MSAHTGTSDDPSGTACHGDVHRVPAGTDARACRRALSEALDADPRLLGGGPLRLWCEPVAGPSGGALADRRRDRELRIPVAESGTSPVRLTLLEYEDGVRDLVVVARSARVGRTGLTAIAVAALGAEPSCGAAASGDAEESRDAGRVGDAVAPGGGDGPTVSAGRGGVAAPGAGPRTPSIRSATGSPDSPGDAHGAGPAEFSFALPDLPPSAGSARDLACALELVLARTCDERRTVLDVRGPDGRVSSRVPGRDEGLSVAEYRAAAAGPHPSAATPPDEAGARFALTVDTDVPAATRVRHRPAPTAGHGLAVHVEPDGQGGLTALARYRPSAVPEWRARAVVRHLVHVVGELAGGDQRRALADVPLLDPEERDRVLALGRTEGGGRAAAAPIHELVLARAAAAPLGVALTDGGTEVGYRDLTDRAGRLAHALRSLGVAPRDRVGVCLERTADLVVVLLGVLMAGATYVPLDPAHPKDRLAFTADDAGLGVVVVDEGAGAADAFAPGVAVPLGRLGRMAEHAPSVPPDSGVGPDDPAYVIYTSGSTGRPKGVVVPHRNVAALLDATAEDFGLGPADTWTWFHSAAFDFSVWEIWGALITGGRLVVVPYWTCRSPDDFRDLLVRQRVTVLNQTPSAFLRLLELERGDARLTDLRLVVFGGEPLDARGLLPWFDAHPESRCRVVNMFGITETTVHVTARTVTRADALAATRSVGRAIPGWSVRVVDDRGRLLPPGSAGEIAVAGAGLAAHYLNRPGLTARRFVTDAHDGTRLYLSGDKGRLLPDGGLEHLGRLDSQVKLRGYRIELDEIRHVLLGHDAVRAAAVVLGRTPGDEPTERLDAYVVLDGADPAEVRGYAAGLLPEYMMPGTLTPVPELPLTVNGKVDVAGLPAPDEPVASAPPPGAPADAPEAAGATSLGTVLAAWREVLGTDCSAADDFFDLGGNSLLALRIVHTLRDRDVRVGVREVYRLRTAGLLAEYADLRAEGPVAAG
ncbi:amino acid adenylation domain-containing protein [Streptomyces fructofermentans]|uniref:amino acid adenylation domain-containing protein n=1 Tax=Streptomyces fructofermentans TaxID=152141 RepID=UPI0037B84F94